MRERERRTESKRQHIRVRARVSVQLCERVGVYATHVYSALHHLHCSFCTAYSALHTLYEIATNPQFLYLDPIPAEVGYNDITGKTTLSQCFQRKRKRSDFCCLFCALGAKICVVQAFWVHRRRTTVVCLLLLPAAAVVAVALQPMHGHDHALQWSHSCTVAPGRFQTACALPCTGYLVMVCWELFYQHFSSLLLIQQCYELAGGGFLVPRPFLCHSPVYPFGHLDYLRNFFTFVYAASCHLL